MGKRYYRRKTNYDATEKFLFGIISLSFIVTYVNTRNINLSATVSCVIFGIFMVTNIIRLQRQNQKLLESGIDIVDHMNGHEFEYFLKAHFEKLGYRVKMTPASNDYGADLILTDNDCKIVVQAKRWNDKVGIKAVQEIVGAIQYYQAGKAIVVTNSYFTDNAWQLANANSVELWDRNKLIQVMQHNQGRGLAQQIVNETMPGIDIDRAPGDNPVCPKCGRVLIKRNGYRGTFFGCSGFPDCRFTHDI